MAAAKSQNAKQTKTAMIIFIVIAIVLVLIGAIVTIGTWDYMILGKTVNLNETSAAGQAPQKGDYATFNVRFVLGNYAETKHTINGFIPAGTEQHYVIILDDGSLMSLTLKNKSDIEKLEAMVDPTWNYLTGEGEYPLQVIEMTGQIKSSNSEIRGYFNDALRKVGATTDIFPHIYDDLTLDATDSRLHYFIIVGVILLLAAGCIVLVFVSKKKLKQLKNIQAIAVENSSDPSLNPFLQQNGNQQNPYTAAGNPAQGQAANPYVGGVNMPQNQVPNPYAGGIDMPQKSADAASAAVTESSPEIPAADIPEMDPFAAFSKPEERAADIPEMDPFASAFDDHNQQ